MGQTWNKLSGNEHKHENPVSVVDEVKNYFKLETKPSGPNYFHFVIFGMKDVFASHQIPFEIVAHVTMILRRLIDVKYEVSTFFSPLPSVGCSGPYGSFIDRDGNLIYSEFHSSCVRKVTPDGEVIVIAGKPSNAGKEDGKVGDNVLNGAAGLCVHPDGDIYICDFNNNLIRRLRIEDNYLETIKTQKFQLKMPSGVAIDIDNTVVFCDCHNHNIKRIAKDGTVTIIAGDKDCTSGFVDGYGLSARFFHPAGICSDGKGNFYITDHWNHGVRKLARNGEVTTVAGHGEGKGFQDGVGKIATFDSPQGIGFYQDSLFVADMHTHIIRKIDLCTSEVITVAGHPNLSGSSNGVGQEAKFYHPIGVYVEKNGNILVTDASNNLIRRLTPQYCRY